MFWTSRTSRFALVVLPAADCRRHCLQSVGSNSSTRPKRARQPAVSVQFSPLMSWTIADSGQVRSVGTTRPTPLPDRVGAKHSTCSGPSCRRYGPRDARGSRRLPRARPAPRISVSVRPTCRTICGRRLRLPSPPYRHRKGSYDRDDPAGRSDACPFDEHSWCVGIVGIPPPEEGRRKIDRNARREFKPGVPELGLIAEPPRRPLRRGPRRDQYDQDHGGFGPKVFWLRTCQLPRSPSPSSWQDVRNARVSMWTYREIGGMSRKTDG